MGTLKVQSSDPGRTLHLFKMICDALKMDSTEVMRYTISDLQEEPLHLEHHGRSFYGPVGQYVVAQEIQCDFIYPKQDGLEGKFQEWTEQEPLRRHERIELPYDPSQVLAHYSLSVADGCLSITPREDDHTKNPQSLLGVVTTIYNLYNSLPDNNDGN